MIVLIIAGAVLGAVLGLRYTMFALVPVIWGAVFLVVVNGTMSGNGFMQITLSIFLISTAVEVGYVLGNIVRQVATSAQAQDRRVSMPHSAKLPGSA
jgi:hypothetical protein